jgi:transposase
MGASKYPERLKIEQLSKKGLTDRQIAEQLCLSIPTIRKWRRKLKQGGKGAVLSHIGRPKQGALNSYPGELVEQLKRWCKQHPGWGAKTLRTELALNEAFANQPLTSRAAGPGRTTKLHARVVIGKDLALKVQEPGNS